MFAKNKCGWVLLDYFIMEENEIDKYNVTGSYVIVNINGNFLFGFNKYRKQWELPSGGIEAGETARAAAERELFEETHQKISELTFKGLIKVKKPNGEIAYQAVYNCFKEKLSPFDKKDDDEMDEICLWDFKENIGYVDECDLKIINLFCL